MKARINQGERWTEIEGVLQVVKILSTSGNASLVKPLGSNLTAFRAAAELFKTKKSANDYFKRN